MRGENLASLDTCWLVCRTTTDSIRVPNRQSLKIDLDYLNFTGVALDARCEDNIGAAQTGIFSKGNHGDALFQNLYFNRLL